MEPTIPQLNTDPKQWESIPHRIGMPNAATQACARRMLNELSILRSKGTAFKKFDQNYLSRLWVRANTRQLSGTEVINLDAIYCRYVTK